MPGNLIYYALVLIVIALVAAMLGFGGVAGTAMSGAHLLHLGGGRHRHRGRSVRPHTQSLSSAPLAVAPNRSVRHKRPAVFLALLSGREAAAGPASADRSPRGPGPNR